MMKRPLARWLALCLCGTSLTGLGAERLELRPDDHIAILGGGLADRMQHSGALETLTHAKFPEHHLVWRHLGFAGDEVAIRMRSEAFGSPDDWLKKEKADVILAFFGYNESHKGEAGLAGFRRDVEKFIQDTLRQNYSGKGAPRLVLFSPTAPEKHPDPNMPDPTLHYSNLKLYTGALADVAKANGVPFVDLFSLSERVATSAGRPLTINGVHLSDAGYDALAPAMFEAIFGQPAPTLDKDRFEKLRAGVNDKNWQFFQRYRTVDGYNVYGGRSHLEFGGVKNRDALLREMDMRDVMTANRERRVWALAQDGDLEVKDDNLPAAVEVKTNKPGPKPDGSHEFLSGTEAIQRMKVPPGCQVNLFASEEQFPQLVNPVQMAFDTRGRLWVAAWPNYPERTPQSKQGDSLLVFDDTNGDGKADRCTPFLDDLNCPTGFQFYKDGVIVVQAPDVWFVRDTDGDGRGDWKERIVNGLDSADSHHTANALVLDPGGSIYLSDGVFHRTQMETPWGPPIRNQDAAIYRLEPRTLKVETYIAYGFANPHGRVFDAWGNDFVTDATGNNTYFGPAFSGRLDYPDKHAGLREFWKRPSRPCPGTGLLSSRHFPEEFQNNYLNCNVIGFLGIFRVKFRPDGSGIDGDTIEPALVQSEDPNFRPTAVGAAPDGSVYFLDWHNPIIGHMQHNIRDPSRDHAHGRVYRITYPGRPLLTPPAVAGEPIPRLLALLTSPEDDVRTRAKIELGARDTAQVLSALPSWTDTFSSTKPEDQHPLLEALWVHQWHNIVNEPLLRQLLQSPEPRARAAALRVLGYWRDRVSDALGLVRIAANDPAPRVRLEAVRVASYFTGPEALEVAQDVLGYETDYYLDYTFNETQRQLRKSVKGLVLPRNAKALARVVGGLSNPDLLLAPPVEAVLTERVRRNGLDVNARNEALTQLAKLHQSDRLHEILAALKRHDTDPGPPAAIADLGFLLAVNPSGLKEIRPDMVNLAAQAKQPGVRRAAFAGLVAADAKPDPSWAATAGNATARIALIESVIHHTDPSFRGLFAPLFDALLKEPSPPADVKDAVLIALPLLGPDHAANSFTLLTSRLRQGHDLTIASRAIMQLPRETWIKAEAGPVAEAILAWAAKVPAGDRSAQDYVETVQVGMEMAVLLPRADNTRIRKALLDLGVRVFAIKSVREGMRYDTTRIVVEAGKPFVIIFENVDMMPHNFVLVQPGAREEIGTQAQTMPPTPDAKGHIYVPKNPKVIAASHLLEPGSKETLKLTAPEKPGDYDYVCTYPEHWKVMFGQLIVVKDLDAYLESSAQAPPPAPAPAAAHQHQH